MESFAKRLVELRKERGMTQGDIAKLIGKARTSVQGYETENKEPSYELLCFLADYFDVSTDYLLGHTDVRSHNDIVFLNDTKAFAASFDALPADLKKVVGESFEFFFELLSPDMKRLNADRLTLYRNLISILQKGRAEVSGKVEAGRFRGSDPAYLSGLMASQSDLKSSISIVLDELMQADLSSSAKKDSGRQYGKTAI